MSLEWVRLGLHHRKVEGNSPSFFFFLVSVKFPEMERCTILGKSRPPVLRHSLRIGMSILLTILAISNIKETRSAGGCVPMQRAHGKLSLTLIYISEIYYLLF